MIARLRRLQAEIASDLTAFESQLQELASLDFDTDATLAGELARAAIALHSAYGAVEGALSRIAREVDDGEPTGADSHAQLLAQMALDIPGVRPAVLSAEALTHIRRLLGFRHFLRHAYAASLDRERLLVLRRHALALGPILVADLAAFASFLAALAGSDPPG